MVIIWLMMVNYGVLWLVVDLPLWKMMEFVSWNYWKIWKNKIHVPKHQPVLMRGLFDSPPGMSNVENPWTKWRFQWEIINSWFVKLPCLIKKVAIYSFKGMIMFETSSQKFSGSDMQPVCWSTKFCGWVLAHHWPITGNSLVESF